MTLRGFDDIKDELTAIELIYIKPYQQRHLSYEQIEELAENSLELTTPTGKGFTVSYKGNTTFTCVPHSSEVQRELPASIEYVKQILRGVKPENIYCESYVIVIIA